MEEKANLLAKLPTAVPDAPEYVPLLNEFWTCGYNSYADELRECNGIKLDQRNWDLQEARGQCRLCCALWLKDWAVDRACHEHTPELIYKDRAASTAEMQESFWAEAIDWAVHTFAVRLQRTQEERAEREEAALKWEAEERAREERSEIDLEICAQCGASSSSAAWVAMSASRSTRCLAHFAQTTWRSYRSSKRRGALVTTLTTPALTLLCLLPTARSAATPLPCLLPLCCL